MNRSRCNNKPTYYILLKKGLSKQGTHEFLVKHKSFEVSRGEILEEVDHSVRLDGRFQIALFSERLHLKLLCPIEMAARLTEVEAESLKSITSLEDRYDRFVCQARQSCFREPPPSGSKVFVAINGRDIPGVVQSVNKGYFFEEDSPYPTYYCPAFGGSIQVKIDEQECSVQDRRLVTSGTVAFHFIQTGGIGVWVSLKQLRSRQGNADDWEMLQLLFMGHRPAYQEAVPKKTDLFEALKFGHFVSYHATLGRGTNPFECQASEDLSFCQVLVVEDSPEVGDTVRELAKAKSKQEKLESILQTHKNKLKDAESLLRSETMSLALERQAHEETKRLLVSTQNDLKEKERDLISSEQMSTEFGKKLTMQEDLYKELELKKKELEQQLACEQKAKTNAEDRLQNSEQKSQELETTLATAQRCLKKRQESGKQFDWMLKREEIHLTEDILGSGTFGTVHKGMFRGTPVAVKKVEAKPKFTEYNEENFRREMKMAATCRHPCMLQFIGATSDDKSPLLVTELLDTSLNAILLDRALEANEIKTIALDIAKGLNYLHLNQPNPIVHRDISSGNVLLWKHGESWRGKVSDYGNAVMMNYARTGSGGAVPYLAPEMGNQKFSTKSDVYSYGVLLLEMCLQREPSCLDDRDELTCLVENATLRSLIRRCLQQDLKQRPSMDEIITILNGLTV